LNNAFLTEMYRAASGIQQEPTARGGRADQVQVTGRDANKFKIFFPSEQTLQKSRGGAGYVFHTTSPSLVTNKLLG
jgi:hypothetical protein